MRDPAINIFPLAYPEKIQYKKENNKFIQKIKLSKANEKKSQQTHN